MSNIATIYIELLDEDCPVSRPAQALVLGNGLFKVLPPADYNQADEVWEFSPGSIVRCEKKNGIHGEYLYAVEKV